MDKTGGHYANWNKPVTEGQILYDSTYVRENRQSHRNREKNGGFLVLGAGGNRALLFSGGSSAGKESICTAGDPGSILGSGRSPGEGIGYPLQYSLASLVTQLVKNPPAMRETWVGKILWRREQLPTPVFCLESCVDCIYSPWVSQELDTNERLSLFIQDEQVLEICCRT